MIILRQQIKCTREDNTQTFVVITIYISWKKVWQIAVFSPVSVLFTALIICKEHRMFVVILLTGLQSCKIFCPVPSSSIRSFFQQVTFVVYCAPSQWFLNDGLTHSPLEEVCRRCLMSACYLLTIAYQLQMRREVKQFGVPAVTSIQIWISGYYTFFHAASTIHHNRGLRWS